jgi:hypothetical protein
MKLFLAMRGYQGVVFVVGVFSSSMNAVAAIRAQDTGLATCGAFSLKPDGRIEFERYGEIVPITLDERYLEDEDGIAITT